jgi:hypothetical protein
VPPAGPPRRRRARGPDRNRRGGARRRRRGAHDGGEREDRIGTLVEFSEIAREEPNETDSALVGVDPDALRENAILDVGALAGFRESTFDEEHRKSGRTTGVTAGDLRAEDVEIEVQGYYPDEAVTFTGVDAFDPMSSGGDSGSLIGRDVDDAFHGTNLLFAGSPFVTFGIPWSAVIEEHGELSVANPPDGGGGNGDDDGNSVLDRIRDFLGELWRWLVR